MKEMDDTKQWETFKKEMAATAELIIFKRSPICPISRRAEREFNRWADSLLKDVKLILVKVDVIAAKQLSRQIAAELKVVHQSPQVIWLTGPGEVKWHASHYAITVDNLNSQL